MQYDKPNAQERVGHSVDNLLVDCCESERVDNCSVTKNISIRTNNKIYLRHFIMLLHLWMLFPTEQRFVLVTGNWSLGVSQISRWYS